MQRDRGVLLDISLASGDILAFAHDVDEAAFLKDLKTQSAVLHKLIVIGEAVRRLSSDFTAAYPEIPWHEIAGMRNRIVHDYERVDLREIWNVVRNDIPVLLDFLRSLHIGE